MGAIASLLAQISSGQEIKQLIARLHQTEVLIGEWHDRIVLLESLNQFVKSESGIHQELVKKLEDLKHSIEIDQTKRLNTIMPMVIELTDVIRQKPLNHKKNNNPEL